MKKEKNSALLDQQLIGQRFFRWFASAIMNEKSEIIAGFCRPMYLQEHFEHDVAKNFPAPKAGLQISGELV